MNRPVHIENQYPSLQYTNSRLKNFFHTLDTLADFTIPPGELSVVFLNNDAMIALHTTYLNDPSPTDVITFPGDSSMHFAGEICVSVDYAKTHHNRFHQSFSQELSLYLIHGWLHLAGYNDLQLKEKKTMRQAENKVFTLIKQPLPDFHLTPGPS